MPDIEDDDRPLDANESSQALRAELAAGLKDQGVDVPAEAVAGKSASSVDEVVAAAAQRMRDEKGRFADPKAQQPATAEQDATDKLSAALPAAPPGGWSPEAKAEFNRLPDAVKAAIAKRETEVDNGFAKLRDYKEIEPYAQQYAQQGMSVAQVLTGYHEAEQFLQKDFIGGINALCQRYQIDPRAVAITMAQQAGIMPNGGQAAPQAAGMTAQERAAVQQLVAHAQNLEREVNGLKQQVKINGVRDVAAKARAAGASISGGPSSTPPPAEHNLGLRATLERGFYGSDRA